MDRRRLMKEALSYHIEQWHAAQRNQLHEAFEHDMKQLNARFNASMNRVDDEEKEALGYVSEL